MMRIYMNGWLPPRGDIPGIEYKFVEAADHHDVAEAAIKRLNICIQADSPLAPIMKAWVEVLSDREDIRRGILIWHIMHSKRSDKAKWVGVLNYANGRFRT